MSSDLNYFLFFASLFWSRTFFSTKGNWGVRKSLKLLVSFKIIEVNANRYNNHACKCKKEYLFKDDVNCHLHLHSPLKMNSHFICVAYFRVNQDIQSGTRFSLQWIDWIIFFLLKFPSQISKIHWCRLWPVMFVTHNPCVLSRGSQKTSKCLSPSSH